jgi:hypothetical protein
MGATGYRQYVMSHGLSRGKYCPSLRQIIFMANTAGELLELFGKPNYMEYKEGKITYISYTVYHPVKYGTHDDGSPYIDKTYHYEIDEDGKIEHIMVGMHGG